MNTVEAQTILLRHYILKVDVPIHLRNAAQIQHELDYSDIQRSYPAPRRAISWTLEPSSRLDTCASVLMIHYSNGSVERREVSELTANLLKEILGATPTKA